MDRKMATGIDVKESFFYLFLVCLGSICFGVGLRMTQALVTKGIITVTGFIWIDWIPLMIFSGISFLIFARRFIDNLREGIH